MPIASVNPATGETFATFSPHTAEEVEVYLARAAAAFRTWRARPVVERTAVVAAAAEVLAAERERLARLMTLEMGKPIAASLAEVDKCALACRYYANQGAQMIAPEAAESDGRRAFVRFDPLGPVLAVMPWNFPLWQVFRFAAPALVAGNVGLLKHASNVPQAALAIEEVFRRAGAPEGVFQTLLIEASRVAPLMADPRVVAATLTGSEPAGASLAQAAGRALKKVVLELGGSDPFLVLPSADLDRAVSTAVAARVINNGQSCIAAKRFIVHRAVSASFTERFRAQMAALKVGDPLDPSTDVGPLATPAILEELDDQVRRTVAAGARLELGGRPLDRPGNFYAPTMLTDVPRDSAAAREELFGPVAPILVVDSLDEAIELANGTEFGLGAAAFTRDPAEQERLAVEIEAGSVFLNGMVKSDPRLPFGGVKRSGFGRELATWGLREFVNVKTVWMG